MFIDGLNPLGQRRMFRFRLVRLLAFDFENQRRSRCQPNQKIGAVFSHDAAVDVQNLEAEVIVLDPSFHEIIMLQLVCLRGLPAAVKRGDVDVRLSRLLARAGGIPLPHVGGAHNRPLAVEHRGQPARVFEADCLQMCCTMRFIFRIKSIRRLSSSAS